MESVEVFNDMDRLWFFSNVLSTPSPSQFRKPTSPISNCYQEFIRVHERVSSWLDDSVEAAIAAVEEEEYEEELEKEEEALEAESVKRLENAEQSTLIAMVMAAPVASMKRAGESRRVRKKKVHMSRRKVTSLKNEVFERRRSVLGEIQSGYFQQKERWIIFPEHNQFWRTPFGKQTARKQMLSRLYCS